MRHYFVLLFLAVTLSCSAKQGVSQQTDDKHTFVVDENLPAPEKNFEILSGELIAKQWASENKVNKTIAYSFENEDLCNLGQDNFFKCMVQAYAGHHSVILSPDIIWNVIAQGFSQHVNNNPEALRDRIVYHEKGKITLSVITKEDLHSPNVKWDELLDTFEKQITENTKDNLADVMRADFSTTDKTARIVSQMTLMSSVKSFLNYEIHYLCGIPSITIEGTPEDWQKVLKKTEQLRKYDLDWWVDDLVPILNEFVKASEGKVDKAFWQSIVKQKRVDELRRSSCGSKNGTKLDGWFLKLMPYTKKGERTPKEILCDSDMPAQMLSIDFQYKNTQKSTTTPMEMLCGFVGIEVDSTTNTMRPKLGWMVCEKNIQLELEAITENTIQVHEIPDLLQSIEYEPSISLTLLKDDIKFPDWFGNLRIDRIKLEVSKNNDGVKEKLEKIFPNRIVTSEKVDEEFTKYIVQVKKSFEPENHIFTRTQIYNSLRAKIADFHDEYKLIKENRRIPESHNGSVAIECFVDIDGSISDFEIIDDWTSATNEMKEEALRLARLLPKYTPAMVSNVENEPLHKVKSKYILWIPF